MSSACARSKIGQNRLSSRKTSLARPWIIAPLKPSLVVRSSSSAAAFGSLVGSAAKPANRVGFAATTAWRRSLTRCVTSTASAPESFCAEGAPWDRTLHVDPGLVHLLKAQLAGGHRDAAGLFFRFQHGVRGKSAQRTVARRLRLRALHHTLIRDTTSAI